MILIKIDLYANIFFHKPDNILCQDLVNLCVSTFEMMESWGKKQNINGL